MIDWIPWAFWIIGTLGVGLTLVCIFAAPAVVTFLLNTNIGHAIIAGFAGLMLALGVGYYGYQQGADYERAKCKAAQDAADAESKTRDAQQGQLAGADAAARLAQLEDQSAKDKETIDAYAKDLAARKSPGCALGPDDLR